MSRRSRRRREDDSRPQRDHTPPRSLTPLLRPISLAPHSWVDVEDRRRHHSLAEWAPPKTFAGRPAKIKVKTKFSRPHKSAGFTVPGIPKKIKFEAPKKVLVCVRRETRREVLFAKRKTRKGASGSKHRNIWSEVSC